MAMELGNIQSIAEIGAGLATVITLIYLAAQIRDNTSSSKRAALDDYVDRLGRWMASLRSDPDSIALFIKGNTQFGSFSPEEKFRYHLTMGEFFGYCEAALGHAAADGLKAETRDRTYEQIKRQLSGHGAKEWWKDYGRKTCAKDFVALVDGLID